MQKILSVTTYNRLPFLQEMLQGFFRYTKNKNEWILIIADDGSSDGTKDFIEKLDFPNTIKIYNNRVGISNQTNSIFLELAKFKEFVCFKADDDMMFIKEGWDRLYLEAMKLSGFQHLCFDHPLFNQFGEFKENVFLKPVVNEPVLARTPTMFTKGCFYTITNSILESVGYMDSEIFFHGFEHIDYSMRCARAGFNDPKHIFDAKNSDLFLSYRFPILGSDRPSLERNIYKANSNGQAEIEIKKQTIMLPTRIFVGYNQNKRKVRDKPIKIML
jgi:GT2 family glycosyltransferase